MVGSGSVTEQSFAPLGPASGFRIGDVFSLSFSAYGRKLPVYVLIGLVLNLPNLYIAFERPSLFPTQTGDQPVLPPGYWLNILLTVVFGILVYAISQAALLHAALQDLRGRALDLGATAARALSRTLPILATMFLTAMAIWFSAALLIIPAFIVWMMLSVAIPVCVDETANPFTAMGRSAELTKGYRWQIFGIQIVYFAVFIILNLALRTAIAASFSLQMVELLTFPIGVVGSSYGAVLTATMYYALRAAKEGPEGNNLAMVFD